MLSEILHQRYSGRRHQVVTYPGLTYIGSGKMTGLYGLDETIHDQKSIGLQHLYIEDYQHDLVYQGVSVVKHDDRCYYGDRIKPRKGHPTKQASEACYSEDGYRFINHFKYDGFRKKDTAFCASDKTFCFHCEITNDSDLEKTFEIAALVITTNKPFQVHRQNNKLTVTGCERRFHILTADRDVVCRVSKDAPSGFMYHGIQDMMFGLNTFEDAVFESDVPMAMTLTKTVTLKPGEGFTFKWAITTEASVDFSQDIKISQDYWKQWLETSNQNHEPEIITNLIALKAINMSGFIPADLTGHYFAGDHVCFYVRDAVLGSRAFLYSGHYKECRQVLELVGQLERKENHELFQRYNATRQPDEGANNNVFSQIDVIGYLLRVTADYYHLTGELVMDVDRLVQEVSILDTVGMKNGLYGPEGGVNEGVYGPAFIISTNIFIAGGLKGLLELLKPSHPAFEMVEKRYLQLVEAIDRGFMPDGYYGYGYVDYHDELIRRYDTPQLFGASLGFPMIESYKNNFKTLTDIATYYDYGYGYSEQQYHDGPWLFNTAFAAQNAYILEMDDLYKKIIHWMTSHKNGYGLLPEAVDARDESKCMINPLMWANAEYVCAHCVDVIKRLRMGELNDNRTV